MKIAVIGDIHLENNAAYDVEDAIQVFLKKNEIELLLIAGDIETDYVKTIAFIDRLKRNGRTDVRYVPGNHDLWNQFHPEQTTEEIYAHYLQDPNCLCNKPYALGDYVIFGDVGWYDYSYGNPSISFEEYEKMERGGRVWQDFIKNQWTRDNIGKSEFFIQKLRQQMDLYKDMKKILVTHMVSHEGFCVPLSFQNWDYFNAFLGSRKLKELILDSKVTHAVCGHVHYRRNITEHGTTWLCRCLNYESEWGGDLDVYRQVRDAIDIICI